MPAFGDCLFWTCVLLSVFAGGGFFFFVALPWLFHLLSGSDSPIHRSRSTHPLHSLVFGAPVPLLPEQHLNFSAVPLSAAVPDGPIAVSWAAELLPLVAAKFLSREQ